MVSQILSCPSDLWLSKDVRMLTTCDKVIFLYHGVSSTGKGFVKGDRFSGSVKGLDAPLCDVPKGFAAFLA